MFILVELSYSRKQIGSYAMKAWKTIMNEFISWKWLVVIIILFPYEAMLLQRLQQTALSFGVAINQWDLITQSLNDHIVIYYFLLPLWLINSCYILMREWDYSILLRMKGYSQWITYTIYQVAISLFWFLLLWIIIVLLVSRGIPIENSWSNYALDNLVPGNYSVVLQRIGLPPLFASFLQCLLLGVFLIFVHVSMAAFCVLSPRIIGLSILALVYFIGSLVSFRMLPERSVWLKVENFMILSSGAYAFPSLVISFIMPIGGIFICYLIVWISKHRNGFYLWIKDKQAVLAYFFLCLLGILITFIEQVGSFKTLGDYFFSQFFGLSEDGAALIVYLFYCLVFFGAIYLFQYQLNDDTNGSMYYQVIRYRSYDRWFGHLMLKNMFFLGFMLLFWALIIILVGVIQGLAWDVSISVVPRVSIGKLIYQYFVNGLLQMINYWLIVFIVHWVWRSRTSNLMVLGLLIVAGWLNRTQVLPVGLNGSGWLLSENTNLYFISGKLLFCILIEWMIVVILFRSKKVFHEGEG